MGKLCKVLVVPGAVLGIALLFIACGGGGGGGGDVTYNGSTDPAVADSTTATVLAEYGMGTLEAGFPLAQVFVTPPPGLVPQPLSAEPLIYIATTTVVYNLTEDAVIDGSQYDPSGTGTEKLQGTLTLSLGNTSALSVTWTVIEAELDGSILFDDFSIEDGPAVTGKVTVPSGVFFFTGPGEFNTAEGDFTGDPGLPVWTEMTITFSNISVSDGDESWTLGEGDWHVISPNPEAGGTLNVNSLTVGYEGSTYKLEDTKVNVNINEPLVMTAVTAKPLFVPLWDTAIEIEGTNDNFNGTFYHPDLGKTWFSGEIYESEAVGIIDGQLDFYDAANEGNLIFTVYFTFDELEGATAYWVDFNDGSYDEFGYYEDGTFTPDPAAGGNFV